MNIIFAFTWMNADGLNAWRIGCMDELHSFRGESKLKPYIENSSVWVSLI